MTLRLRAHFIAGAPLVAVPFAQLLIGSGQVEEGKLILRSQSDTGDMLAQELLEDLDRWD